MTNRIGNYRQASRKAECRRASENHARDKAEKLCEQFKIPLHGKDSRKLKLFPTHPYWRTVHNSYKVEYMTTEEAEHYMNIFRVMQKCLSKEFSSKTRNGIFFILRQFEKSHTKFDRISEALNITIHTLENNEVQNHVRKYFKFAKPQLLLQSN